MASYNFDVRDKGRNGKVRDGRYMMLQGICVCVSDAHVGTYKARSEAGSERCDVVLRDKANTAEYNGRAGTMIVTVTADSQYESFDMISFVLCCVDGEEEKGREGAKVSEDRIGM